jgi:flagellar protein FliO/FliZ
MNKVVEPSQWFGLLTSFGLVIALLLATLWVLRRMGANGLRKQAGRRIELLDSLWLGNRQRLVLVKVNGQEILVGVSQQSVVPIERWPQPQPAMQSTEAPDLQAELQPAELQPGIRERFLSALKSAGQRPHEGESRS